MRHGVGGARRDRTADLLHAMQALSQLSYSPKNEARTLLKSLHIVNIFMQSGFDFFAKNQTVKKSALLL